MFPKSFPKTCGYEADFLPLQQSLTNPLFYGNIIRISAGDVAQQERIVPRDTTHHSGQETEEGQNVTWSEEGWLESKGKGLPIPILPPRSGIWGSLTLHTTTQPWRKCSCRQMNGRKRTDFMINCKGCRRKYSCEYWNEWTLSCRVTDNWK